MRSVLSGATALGLALATITPAHTARACSAPICWPETFAPSWNGTMPVNLQALWWTPGSDSNLNTTEVSDLQLACTNAAGDVRSLHVQAGAGGALLVDDAFAVGDRCEISTYCDDPYDDRDAGIEDLFVHTRFTITEAADPPRALELIANAARWHYVDGPYDDSGDCFAPGTYHCSGSISANLNAADVAPWTDVLAFDVLGEDGAWHALAGFGVSRSPGTYTVTLRARLPDGSLALESDAQTLTIEDCTTPQPTVDAGDDGGGSTLDAGDGGASMTDAGPSLASESGCHCSTVGGTSTSRTWSGLTLLLAAWFAARVRSSRVAWRARARRG